MRLLRAQNKILFGILTKLDFLLASELIEALCHYAIMDVIASCVKESILDGCCLVVCAVHTVSLHHSYIQLYFAALSIVCFA